MSINRPTKFTQKDHVAKLGQQTFAKACAAALTAIMDERAFVGLDRVRSEVAKHAALRATGFPIGPLVLSKFCGPPIGDVQRIAEAAVIRATRAARKALGHDDDSEADHVDRQDRVPAP